MSSFLSIRLGGRDPRTRCRAVAGDRRPGPGPRAAGCRRTRRTSGTRGSPGTLQASKWSATAAGRPGGADRADRRRAATASAMRIAVIGRRMLGATLPSAHGDRGRVTIPTDVGRALGIGTVGRAVEGQRLQPDRRRGQPHDVAGRERVALGDVAAPVAGREPGRRAARPSRGSTTPGRCDPGSPPGSGRRRRPRPRSAPPRCRRAPRSGGRGVRPHAGQAVGLELLADRQVVAAATGPAEPAAGPPRDTPMTVWTW